MATPAASSFIYPKESLGLSLADLSHRYFLEVSSIEGRVDYTIKSKDSGAEAAEGAVRTITDEHLVRQIKLAANRGSLSLHPSLTKQREFQIFARGTLGAESRQSKLHRAIRKASYIGKGLAGPEPEVKILDEHYWLEALIPSHPSGAELQDFFDAWKTSRSTLCFEDWLMLKPARIHPPSVTYLNAEERKAFAVSFAHGRVMKGDRPVCSEEFRSDKADKSAIYVISQERVMYVGPYILSRFQHSSFNEGLPVIGAGEIKIDATGKIKEISSKSGHYKPTAQQLYNTLDFLKGHGIDLADVHLVENSAKSITRHPSAEAYLDKMALQPDPAAAGGGAGKT